MSAYIDRKFLLQMSSKLGRFSQKKTDLFNFRCPLCGDSQKNKLKTRGYVYRKSNDYFYMCHNCGVSTTFYNFIKQVDPTLSKEYQLERYKAGETGNNNYPKPTLDEYKTEAPIFKQKINLPSIESLPDAHFAKVYVKQRKIPESFHSSLYYCEDYANFVASYGIEKNIPAEDKRLIIPFYDKQKNLIGFQGRALGESKIRYITIKLSDEGKKIYGQERIDSDKTIYVFEGPIDSMFIDNAVATADSHLQAVGDVFDKGSIVLVFDNEPRNKELLKQIERAIDEHFNVVIWPEMIEEKDVNEMVLNGFSVDEIQDILINHTHQNLRAKLEYLSLIHI